MLSVGCNKRARWYHRSVTVTYLQRPREVDSGSRSPGGRFLKVDDDPCLRPQHTHQILSSLFSLEQRSWIPQSQSSRRKGQCPQSPPMALSVACTSSRKPQRRWSSTTLKATHTRTSMNTTEKSRIKCTQYIFRQPFSMERMPMHEGELSHKARIW